MNSKKLLALLCATAMATSTLVPVAVSADETAELSEATVLLSDSFDGYENVTYGNGGLTNVHTLAASVAGGETYEAIEGMKLTVCTRGGGDDTSYFLVEEVEEGSGDKALKTSVSRFSNQSRGSRIEFDQAYSATDLPLVIYTRMKMDVIDTNTYAPSFKIGDVIITKDLLYTDTDNEWVDLKIVSYSDGSYEVDVNGNVVSSGSTTTAFSSINFSSLDATGASVYEAAKCTDGYHTIWIDDLVIYNTTLDEITAAAPAAETKAPLDLGTPEPTEEPTPSPEPKAAPVATVPETATKVAEQNFDAVEDVTYSLGTSTTTQAMGDITINIGGRGSGGTTETYAQVKSNIDADKMLKVASGKYGNAARAPYITLNTNVDKSYLGADAYAALTFAARLIPSDTHPATINLLKDLTTSDKLIYQNVAATITTDENDTTGGIIVTPNEWHVFEVLMWADGSAMVVVDGQENSIGSLVSLPVIGTTNANSDTVVNTSVEFDNICAYVDGEYVVPDPTAEPEVPVVEPIPDTKVDFTQDMSGLAADYSQKLGTASGTYTDIAGLTYVIGGREQGTSGDTTSVSVVTDSYANQYLYVNTGTYGINGRAPRFEMTGAPKLAQLATDEDYVAMSFAAKLVPNYDTPATLVFPADTQFSTNGGYYVFNAGTLTTGEVTEGSTTEATVPANEWIVVDVIVYKTGDYSIMVDGSEVIAGKEIGSSGGGSDKVTLSALPYVSTNSTKNVTNAAFAIDNIVAVHTGDIVDISTPEPKAAPAVEADAETTVVFAENFNGLEDSTTKMAITSTDVAVSSNVNVVLGSRDKDGATGESSGDVQYTAVTVKENVASDKVLNLTGGKFGTVTRAPKVQVVNSPDVSAMENDDDFVAMGFAFKLNSVANVTEQISAITLVANSDDTVILDEEGNNTNTETKDDGNVYGYALATITTNEADAAEGLVKVVTADEWHTAYVYVYKDAWYVYVDDEEIATGENVKYSGGDKIALKKLPQIVAAKNTKEVVTYPSVDIDNMVAFTSEVPTLANVAITAATAEAATITADVDTTAKVVVASYAEDGRMVSATTQIVSLVAGENTVPVAAAAGDKVMVWTAYNNSGMQPYCAAVTVQ